uniref:Uncharacterized protein n=1 Tax=Rhodnius prolixus TaxID=13249 RepID=T1HH38_RHOPR
MNQVNQEMWKLSIGTRIMLILSGKHQKLMEAHLSLAMLSNIRRNLVTTGLKVK